MNEKQGARAWTEAECLIWTQREVSDAFCRGSFIMNSALCGAGDAEEGRLMKPDCVC